MERFFYWRLPPTFERLPPNPQGGANWNKMHELL